MSHPLVRWCLITVAALLLLDFALRIGLLLNQQASPSALTVILVLGGGLLRDVAVIALAGALPAMLLAVTRPPLFANRIARWLLATVVIGVAVFLVAVEWFFFDEFSSRFNHIALDYVLFPKEVLTNIWESYNVPLFVAIATVVGGILALPQLRPLAAGEGLPHAGWRVRMSGVGIAAAAALLGLGLLTWLPDGPNEDRRLREVAANGLQSLMRAALTSHLDYEAFYVTGDAAAAAQTVVTSRESGVAAHFPQRQFIASGQPGAERPDVIVVLEESLGSEFIDSLGGTQGVSAGFDAWAQRGLLLSNLFATGNRTVRGMEGVLCSFPPLPGDAIVKRDRTDGCASLAQVFASQGYRTEFVYGGAGTFDNLANFARGTGYEQVFDDGVLGTGSAFPADAFRTAWGVADGTLFDLVLQRQKTTTPDATSRKPLFLTALTVSNHKPFLLPPGAGTDRGWDLRHVVRYSITAAILLVLSAGVLIWGRRAIGNGIAIGLCVAVVGGFAVYVYQKIKPTGSREQAVSYALNSLTTWLDQAEHAGLLRHTVVLVVGDHGARVYGAQQMPLGSYRVPALLIGPETAWQGRRIERLASQIDLAPTLLSLAGISYRAPFFGEDLLQRPTGPGRAFLQHNRDIAVLNDDAVVTFGLQRRIDAYQRRGDGGLTLAPLPPGDNSAARLQDLGMATYQIADQLYRDRQYVVPTP